MTIYPCLLPGGPVYYFCRLQMQLTTLERRWMRRLGFRSEHAIGYAADR